MNSKTSTDSNVVALYTKMDKLCDGLSDEVVLKVTHGEGLQILSLESVAVISLSSLLRIWVSG